MRVRAAQHLAMQQTRQINISTIFCPASDFIDTIMPNGTGSDNFKFLPLVAPLRTSLT